MASLDELALKYGTDKASPGNNYTPIYERYLHNWRSLPITMLEIGVFEGASLRMWRDYFRRGRIWGLDVNPGCAVHGGGRISVITGEQADPDALDSCAPGEDFDLVIDDGGHYPDDQLASLIALWPRLKRGGYYVIEDTATAYWEKFTKDGDILEILMPLVRDVHFRHHTNAVTLQDLGAIAFYGPSGMCVLERAP